MGENAINGVLRFSLCGVMLSILLPASDGILAAPAEEETPIRYAERMPLADQALVLDATPTSFGAVAVGARGHVLLTDDFVEWRQADSVPTRATLTAVEFIGDHGWAVGHDSVILHSADSGRTWERQYFAPEREQPLMDVFFLGQERGYAVGAYDLFMTTTDGGRTWQDRGGVDEMDDWHLNDILRMEDGTLLIAAERGIVYRSTDNARTWESIDLPYEGSMFGILETSPNVALTFGLRGTAFQSNDSGQTWRAVDTGTDSSLFGGRVLQSGEVVLVGSGGTIARRPPSGGRFTATKHGEGESFAGVLQARDGGLVYYGVTGIGLGSDVGGSN